MPLAAVVGHHRHREFRHGIVHISVARIVGGKEPQPRGAHQHALGVHRQIAHVARAPPAGDVVRESRRVDDLPVGGSTPSGTWIAW